MALVSKISRIRKDQPKVHKTTNCEAAIFAIDEVPYLQLDTLGSKDRKDTGQVSQSLQFDRAGLLALRALIDEALKIGER
jgi:hypothetical protein